MARLLPLVLAVFAVFALATVASSLDTVSTAPAIESETTPTGTSGDRRGGGGGPAEGTETRDGPTPTRTEWTATPADESRGRLPLWQVAVGLGLVLVGSAVALYGLTGGEDEERPEERPAPEPTAPAADTVTLGATVPASNDVFRVWRALREAVPQDSTGETPAAVAEAAVVEGYRAEPVVELTDTFCAVRYGEAEPTSERERRARELAAALSLEAA